jgi:hypothetical protein
MAFIKHGDGKIVQVVEMEEMTEQQKKEYRDLAKKTVKTAIEDAVADSSSKKLLED